MVMGYSYGVSEESTSAFMQVRSLPVTNRRAVGGPVARSLLAAYFGSALLAWVAAAVTSVFAAGDLAAGRPLATAPVLAVHLLALGVLPLAVSGASFHLLPVMLRNHLLSQRALWLALPLLWGGVLVASGVGAGASVRVWLGAAAVSAGLAIVLVEIGALVWRAPRDRMLITSRIGVSLPGLHVVAALVLGAVIFDEDRPFAGIAYDRWLLIHLHIALIGWIAVLIVTVGRNLAPMLAQAPAARPRRWPLNEAIIVLGLWVLIAGLAVGSRIVTVAGGLAIALALGTFAVLVMRVVRTRRTGLEAPLAHLAIGAFFLLQAFCLGLVAALTRPDTRLVSAYVILLLVGWAGGVVVGHVGKLLSLSLWVWWPPGPRPKQAALYPRRLGLLEAGTFLIGVEALMIGVLAGSATLARSGAGVLGLSAVATVAGVTATWRRRARNAP
jgi:hypothetical protein